MFVGIPTEIKQGEGRVAVTPNLVREIVGAGHEVKIQQGAGILSGFVDDEYIQAGARVVDQEQVWMTSDLVLKVKEPVFEEFKYLRPHLSLFCFLHLAAEPALTQALLKEDVTAFAFETLEVDGRLPILEPMSAIAGRLSALWSAFLLQRTWGGRGILPGGLAESRGANALIIGGGTVGANAADVLQGLRANVTVSEPCNSQAERLRTNLRGPVGIVNPTEVDVTEMAMDADIVIGSVLVTGAASPTVLSEAVVKSMRGGSVICDVAIDQGGCIETSRPTTHENPTYECHGVVHQCITNLPAAVSRDSTLALTGALRPHLMLMLQKGIPASALRDPVLKTALNVRAGNLEHPALTPATRS